MSFFISLMPNHRLNHKVDIANAMLMIENQKRAMNGMKKFTTKKDPKELALPGPLV